MSSEKHKVCSTCKINKPWSDFSPRVKGSDYPRPECRACGAQKRKTADKLLITRDQYRRMLKEQNGGCAICSSPVYSFKKPDHDLAVDHCHVSGQVRGLLCNDCNVALGFMKDDADRLRKAIAYLEASRQRTDESSTLIDVSADLGL